MEKKENQRESAELQKSSGGKGRSPSHLNGSAKQVMESWNHREPQAARDLQGSSNQTPEKRKGKRRNEHSLASATDFHIQKSGSRLTSMSRLLSDRYLPSTAV